MKIFRFKRENRFTFHMALRATTTYEPVNLHDPDLVKLFQAFFNRENVSDQISSIASSITASPNTYNIRRTARQNRIVVATWWQVRGGRLEAWADNAGYARAMLWAIIERDSLLSHLYYSFDVEIGDALLLESGQLDTMLRLVDVPVTETTQFKYKVTRDDALKLAYTWGTDVNHLTDLIFCVGNYLGRIPTRAEIFGHVALPTAAQIATVPFRVSGLTMSSRERDYGLYAVNVKILEKDPLQGVAFLIHKETVKLLQQFVVDKQSPFYDSTVLKGLITETLESHKRQLNFFEERVEYYFNVLSKVRSRAEKWFPINNPPTIELLLTSVVRAADEALGTDKRLVTQHLAPLNVRNYLLSVGSPFSAAAYLHLTGDLVSAFSSENSHLGASYVESVYFLVLRYAHYNTNSLRYVDLPNKLVWQWGDKTVTTTYNSISAVFAKHGSTIPNIERAWCNPLAFTVFQTLKSSGGTYVKWPDVINVPSYMQFDFVTALDPLKLNETEKAALTSLLSRFRVRKTPVRGHTLGQRNANPLDEIVESIVPTQSRGMLRELTGGASNFFYNRRKR
uniref:HSP90h n=1 Tax=Manihot esculenta associated ampelovirus 2 TaxID=2843332 RepID=A0A8F0FQW0_9CLOS|nr:HSP90h [Manihot esculenta associated ampelovirus 2]